MTGKCATCNHPVDDHTSSLSDDPGYRLHRDRLHPDHVIVDRVDAGGYTRLLIVDACMRHRWVGDGYVICDCPMFAIGN